MKYWIKHIYLLLKWRYIPTLKWKLYLKCSMFYGKLKRKIGIIGNVREFNDEGINYEKIYPTSVGLSNSFIFPNDK